MTTDERMGRLEKELARVRWLNRCLVACIVLSLALWGLTQTFGPEPAWAQSGTKVLQASAFVIQDANDKPRGVFAYVPEKGPMLTLMNEKGDVRAVLGLKPEGPGLELINDNHKTRAQLKANKEFTRLMLNDDTDKTGASLVVGKGKQGLATWDTSAGGGVGLWSGEVGPGLQLCDKSGVIWKAP